MTLQGLHPEFPSRNVIAPHPPGGPIPGDPGWPGDPVPGSPLPAEPMPGDPGWPLPGEPGPDEPMPEVTEVRAVAQLPGPIVPIEEPPDIGGSSPNERTPAIEDPDPEDEPEPGPEDHPNTPPDGKF